jgi:HPt (histidine-containing phosphotransfer) domain-containing protein
MDDYLAKPFSRTQLSAVLARWLPRVERSAQPARSAPQPASTNSAQPERQLDPQAVARIRDMQRPGAPSVLARVIDLYLESTPELLRRLREAARERDPARLLRAAHSLKSGSANLGALELAELCRRLEALGQAGSVDGAAELVERAVREYRGLGATLASLRGSAVA